VRKYICDNCGKEFESQEKLNDLLFRWNDGEEAFLGEYCGECSDKIKARIKEGVN